MAKINLPFYLQPIHKMFNTSGWITEAAEPAGIWRKDAVNFGDIFKTWPQFSRGNSHNVDIRNAAGYGDRAVPSDLAFSYNAADDTVSNPVDTTSLVGFISPPAEAYDEYYFEVQIRSRSNWQQDPVGLVLAYTIDPDGTRHTLTVMRRMWYGYTSVGGGANAPMTVEVDHLTIGEIFIARVYGGLTWGNGWVANETNGGLGRSDPWSATYWMNQPNGIKIKVERRGDIFVINTTQYNGTAYVPSATTIIDLNSHPSLARFKGKKQYGYCCHSQDNTYWRPIFRPGGWRRPFWCSEFAGKESAYDITNYAYSVEATAPGIQRGGYGPQSRPGWLTPPGVRLGVCPILRNWQADQGKTEWAWSRDLYILGPNIKEAEILALGLNPSERITSNKDWYCSWTMMVDHAIARGYLDYNLDTGNWAWVRLQYDGNGGGGRQYNASRYGPVAPPPSRHIYIPAYDSTQGEHSIAFKIYT